MSIVYQDRLRNFLHFLENPNYPSIGPHLYLLGFVGLWNPKSLIFKKLILYIIIAFFFSQYVKCAFSGSLDSVKLILQYAPFHVGIVKCCLFLISHRSWEDQVSFTMRTETGQLAKNDPDLNQTINKYIGYNRRVSYFYWAAVILTLFNIFTEPYMKNEIVVNGTSTYIYIFDGYTPFQREPPGYYISMFIQTVLGYTLTANVAGWDALVVSLMLFYAGQLKVAQIYCRSLIDVSNRELSHKNIVDFHEYYITLVKYQRQLHSLISPSMFVKLIVTSISLGIATINFVELQDNLGTLISSTAYIVCSLIQLFMYYWNSNDVTEESTCLNFAIYESDWIEADKALQKEILLLNLTVSRRLVFKAGPFTEMSLSTFVGILKTAYTVVTVLKGTQ